MASVFRKGDRLCTERAMVACGVWINPSLQRVVGENAAGTEMVENEGLRVDREDLREIVSLMVHQTGEDLLN
jgi:hypothetical protein